MRNYSASASVFPQVGGGDKKNSLDILDDGDGPGGRDSEQNSLDEVQNLSRGAAAHLR